ncbi:MAG: hypothetical protein M3436_11725 [Pseudomonadota bacterium]|nr:hypothetical protein [Pseudomonadota bacterium]
MLSNELRSRGRTEFGEALSSNVWIDAMIAQDSQNAIEHCYPVAIGLL